MIGGTLTGSAAAVYIADNAYVEKIKVLSGAKISGNIISHWDPHNPDLASTAKADLYTQLDFGLKSDSKQYVADSNFDLTLYGGIYGFESLKMRHLAGRLELTGPIRTYSLANDGYLALHADAAVQTAFSNTGSLEIGFYDNGSHTKVQAASYNVAGSTLVYRLEGGYFQSGQYKLSAHHNPFASTTLAGLTFRAVNLDSSPTLKFNFDGDASLNVERPDHAYSQYPRNDNAKSVGEALSAAAEHAQGSMRDLIGSIDFSPKDGSLVDSALTLLSPQAVDAGMAVSILNQQEANFYLNRQFIEQAAAAPTPQPDLMGQNSSLSFNFANPKGKASEFAHRTLWRGFIMPFASFNRMKAARSNPGYRDKGFSILSGADRSLTPELSFGLHALLSTHHIAVRHGHEASLEQVGAFLGSQLLYTPRQMQRYYLSGLMRFGLEDNHLERSYHANGYAGQVKGEYKTWIFASGLQGGKDFYFLEHNSLRLGPVCYLDYAYVFRPSFSESGAPFALKYWRSRVHSLSTAVGAHLDYLTSIYAESTLSLSFITLWKHEYLKLSHHSPASFRDYETAGFESTTRLPDRDSLMFQLGLRLNLHSSFFVEAAAATTLRKHGHSLSGLIQAGWKLE